nr:odv-ec43 [Spodoptera frugiperda granulovirus]
MSCPANVRVYISDAYVLFPYQLLTEPPRDAGGAGRVTTITVYVPTFEDVAAVNKALVQRLGYTDVIVEKHTAHDKSTTNDTVVVYWNVISHINRLGYGETRVFSVVLSDNLFTCGNVEIVSAPPASCPMHIEYNYADGDCVLDGELPADYNIMQSIKKYNSFVIVFNRETPMGIKILNVKRFMILFSMKTEPVKFSIYLPHDEQANIQKELTWENTRRVLRGGADNMCRAYNPSSVKYVLDALEILGIRRDNVSSVHSLVDIFNPLVLKFRTVPDVFLHINNLTHKHKHVRLYCDGDSLAVSPGGVVPINRPTHNPHKFDFDPLRPPPEQFYLDLGTRDIYVQVPRYNYFL